ncbi:MAG: low molecular weight protein arginine phosphatase [Firmicutes bacterium]|nr:low molecular weight protein arginine phosphatase [Bacillota bacterium]
MNILFVCTGNTCRSSMAQALLEHMVAEQGLTQITVQSAGIAAEPGAKASPMAEQALRELGIDLTGHRAQGLNQELVDWADLILTMTRRHKEFVLDTFPSALEKTYVLKEFLLGPADEEQEQTLHELYAAMAAKKEAFAAEVRPNISELQARRAQLLEELDELEQLLAYRQSQLLERVRDEREAITRLERARDDIDVVDPFGQPLAVYRASRDELREALSQLLQRLQKTN